MDRIMVTDQRLRILHPPTGSLRILTLITEPFFLLVQPVTLLPYCIVMKSIQISCYFF